jgi:hypothetical protein
VTTVVGGGAVVVGGTVGVTVVSVVSTWVPAS